MLKYRNIITKLVIFTAVIFLLLVTVTFFIVYPYLKNYTRTQIENFSANTFSSFSYQLDEMFLSVERLGENYANELRLLVNSKDFETQSKKLTTSFLNINSFVTKISVYFFPDSTSFAFPFNYYYFNGVLNYEKDFNLDELYKLMDVGETIKDKRRHWGVPYRYFFDSDEDKEISIIVGVYEVPIILRNEVVGVALLYCRMSAIENIMSKINIGGSSYNVLIGSDGNIAVHPLEKYVMQPTDLTDILDRMGASKTNSFNIDSLGNYKCPDSYAFAHKLVNDWVFLTIFPEYSLSYNYDIIRKTVLIILLGGVAFFGTVTIGINILLNNFKLLIRKIIDYSEYDILDWSFPVVKSDDDVELLTSALNKIHKAYTSVQNKYTDLLTDNEKLVFDKEQLNIRIEAIIQEETEAIMIQNKYLNTSLNNMAEFIQIGKAICSSLDIEEISKTIYKHLEQIIPITFFGILLHNNEKNTLECECGIKDGVSVPKFNLNVIEKNTISVICFDKNETIFINNYELEARRYLHLNPLDPLNLQCNSQYFSTIISDAAEVVGIFTIQCKEKGVFRDFDNDYLENMKNYLNMAINNILTYRKLKNSLIQMELTQDRLIQNERMASVGQLSAGIAHEIKNPLNFVINFSEISNTLMKELNETIEEYKKAPSKEIGEDIQDMLDNMALNLNKIEEHSRRVDQIIKNMMIHSNNREAEWAMTDINNIVKEYSKFTYKGFRSNNPSFNINVSYDLDETIEPIRIVQNNFSRVIINIVSNACFAMTEKLKKYDNLHNYTPELKITTTKLNDDYIEIKIKDNGDGIPAEIRNKVFTPFFTTKSVGEGTGLGLSICYDIIHREHNGEITFESEPENFTEFKIKIPRK